MHLLRGPFRWPCGCAGAIRRASTDEARPWLHVEPLDAAIGREFALYRPGGRHGHRWCCELCVLTFLFDGVISGKKCAIKQTQARPGHIGDRQKALFNARMAVALYQGLDVADRKKQDREGLLRT